MTATLPPRSPSRNDLLFLGVFAGLKLLLHLPVLHRYGYHARRPQGSSPPRWKR